MKNVSKITLIMCLLAVAPVSAKMTIGPISLGIEVKNAAETIKQIEQFSTIMEYKNSVCDMLGSQVCDAISNQIAACTKGAMNNIGTIDMLKEGDFQRNFVRAAQGCAGDLWITDCLDSTLGSLNDIKRKANNLSRQPEKVEKIVERQLTNPLTGETIQAKIDLTERAENSLSEGYDLLTGNGAKTQLGANALSAIRNATAETSNMKMVAACSKDALSATEWIPAVSIPNPMDLAPSVPSSIQNILTSTKEGAQDLLSKASSTAISAADYISDTDTFKMLSAGYEAVGDAASLYLEGADALTRLDRNIDGLQGLRPEFSRNFVRGAKNRTLGAADSIDALANVGAKAYDRFGGTTYIDPLLDKAGGALQPYVDGTKDMASGAWDYVAGSTSMQVASDAGSSFMSGVGTGVDMLQGGVDMAYSGVTGVGGAISGSVNDTTTETAKFMDDKMAALQNEITGLMKAGIDTSIEMVRKNQNDMQINSNSNGIGGGQKASALVSHESKTDMETLSDGASSADDIMMLLKQISLVRVQALQKHTAITSLKAQIAEQDAIDAEIAGGVLKQIGVDETEG